MKVVLNEENSSYFRVMDSAYILDKFVRFC